MRSVGNATLWSESDPQSDMTVRQVSPTSIQPLEPDSQLWRMTGSSVFSREVVETRLYGWPLRCMSVQGVRIHRWTVPDPDRDDRILLSQDDHQTNALFDFKHHSNWSLRCGSTTRHGPSLQAALAAVSRELDHARRAGCPSCDWFDTRAWLGGTTNAQLWQQVSQLWLSAKWDRARNCVPRVRGAIGLQGSKNTSLLSTTTELPRGFRGQSMRLPHGLVRDGMRCLDARQCM